MNRVQQRLDLVLIPVDNFCETCNSAASSPLGTGVGGGVGMGEAGGDNNSDHNWKLPLAKKTTPIQVIYSQTSTNWINVNDALTFVEISDKSVEFIWASEESGFRHLYYITASLDRSINSSKDVMIDEHLDGFNLVPRIINKVDFFE